MNISLFNFFFSLSSYPVISGLALFISNIFMYVVMFSAIAITFFVKRDNVYSLLLVGTGAFAWVVSYVIKNVTKIPRPFVALHLTPLFMETGFSFPSSHVTVISALSVIMWNIDHRLGIVFFIFTILVALSRMIIGVHYPVDVIAGLIIGVIIGLSILWFYNITSQFAFLRKYI